MLAAELDQLDLGPGWSDQRQRQTAQDMLDRFLAWHAADGPGAGRRRGRVRRHRRPGPSSGARSTGWSATPTAGWWSSTSRPARRRPRTPRSTASSPPTRWPSPRAASGTTAACPAARRCCRSARAPRPRSSTRSRCPPTSRWRDLGRRAARRGRRGHGGGDLRGAHRHALPAVPGPAQLPAPGARPAGDRMSRDRPVPGSLASCERRGDGSFNCPSTTCSATPGGRARARGGCSTRPRSPPAAGCPTRPRPSRPGWSPRRPTGRSSSSPAPARARPRRWPPGSPGWWPTGWSSPRRSSGSPSPARRPASSTSASGCGSARWPGTPTPTTTCGERLDIAQPTVSTYHGYAAALVAEHGLRIGVEPGAGVLGPGDVLGPGRHGRQRLDRRHERRPADPAHHGRGRPGARRRAGRARHQPGGPARLDRPARGADRRLRRRPAQEGPVQGRHWTMLARQRARVALLPLVEAFEARKRAAGAIDYADQVAYAARIAVASAEVGRRERARWQVVLLDEYQDTSVGQLRMLEALFGRDTGHPVLAVGDPRQSIYGWRGASAGTIERFDRTFPGLPGPPGRAADPGHQLAQRRGRPRRRQRGVGRCCRRPTSRCPTSRPAPTAGRGAVHRRAVRDRRRGDRGAGRPARAAWLERPAGRRDGRPTVAVLVRARKQLPGIAAALRERGPAGGGRRARRPARGARGLRRRRHADRAGRPDRRRRARPAAHRRALADRPARPRRARGPGPGARALAPAGPGPTARTAPRGREPPTERGSIVEALDDLGGPDAYSAGGLPAAAAARRRSSATCAPG